MHFYNPFRRFREAIEILEQLNTGMGNHMDADRRMAENFDTLATTNNLLQQKVDTLNNANVQLQVLQSAMDMVGVRRKFGGKVDIDYPQFIKALGPDQMAEFMNIMNKGENDPRPEDVPPPRRKRKANAKETTAP